MMDPPLPHGVPHQPEPCPSSARTASAFPQNPVRHQPERPSAYRRTTHQGEAASGARVIDRLAADLRSEFPDMRGS
jgi:hypothetical protein